MLKPIVELDRLIAIAPQPHSVATDGSTVWIASRSSGRIDVIDIASWKKTGEIEPPGMPWGMAFGDGALVMTCGEGPGDDRRIRRYIPGGGFTDLAIECPDGAGSHLAVYTGRILLGQWYNKRLLLIDDAGAIARSYDAPHGIAGVTVDGDNAYLVGTDDEDEGEYFFTHLDLRDGSARDVATIPFHARGLAWGGSRFWTNFRAGDRTVTFRLPN